ncbi:hypothetical protein NUU61_004255 [Penicillium alfredii]|uniref:Uncharacterized protein n=1 Tax=Penicillium alfredii TaxID=1506179 RepID=A0A9W9FKX4_9EURO|nr:uncharacterized protein NUU61_004255 [Penicillium alfredii]KAJ5102033.1 hypothetical protein NUU61_004255 [Penicillium alfredii]
MSAPETRESILARLVAKEKVMLASFTGIQQPSAILLDIINDPLKVAALIHAIERQVTHLRQRTLLFDRGEATIFDRTLITLLSQGASSQNFGLMEFYLIHYVHVKPHGPNEHNKALINAHLAGQGLMDSGYATTRTIDTILNLAPASTAGADSAPLHSAVSEETASVVAPLPQQQQGEEEKKVAGVNNLVGVYQRAKAEYYKHDAEGRHDRKSNAVRFLRDTAENLLRHLRISGLSGHPLIAELEELAPLSRSHFIRLTGGRKRSFDPRPPEMCRVPCRPRTARDGAILGSSA